MFSLSGCQLSPKASLERNRRVVSGIRVQYAKGDVYMGDAAKSSSRLPNLFVPHGSGYLTKKNPSPNSMMARYYGKWECGRLHGEGGYEQKKKTGASVTYEGHLSKNGKQGEGIMNKDGEIYRGGWSKNLRHGQGKCCYKNGDVYEGRWIGGKRSGRGRLISKDGSVYVGLWVDGRQHGKGELWYPDGALAYQGDWENGKMSGNGILCYQKSFGAKSLAGRCYEGEFKQNTFEGRGTFYFPMGDCITTGKFIRNQFHGKHQMFWKNGLQLQCSFTQGRLNGNVTATFPDGISTRFVLDNWVSKHANVMGMSANWQIKLKQYLHKQHETKPFEMNTVFST